MIIAYDLQNHAFLMLSSLLCLFVGKLCPVELPRLLRMRISLPRHDLLGEERWPISQRRRTLSLFLNGLLLGLVGTGIQGIYSKAHPSLSGSNDQTIGNIKRTIGLILSQGHLGNKLILCLDPYHLN